MPVHCRPSPSSPHSGALRACASPPSHLRECCSKPAPSRSTLAPDGVARHLRGRARVVGGAARLVEQNGAAWPMGRLRPTACDGKPVQRLGHSVQRSACAARPVRALGRHGRRSSMAPVTADNAELEPATPHARERASLGGSGPNPTCCISCRRGGHRGQPGARGLLLPFVPTCHRHRLHPPPRQVGLTY